MPCSVVNEVYHHIRCVHHAARRLARLTNAQSHMKRIVFEFLERSESFRTSIYNPAPGLPEGFAAFIAAQQKTLSQLRFSRLNNLDGTYRLYRRAWTTPTRRDRVLISRLIITTVGGSPATVKNRHTTTQRE